MAGGIRLEKLNLRAPKAYDYSNYSELEETKVFYYCVSEGATEESYFYGIRNNKVSAQQIYFHEYSFSTMLREREVAPCIWVRIRAAGKVES